MSDQVPDDFDYRERYFAMTGALLPDWNLRASMPPEECIRLLIAERDRFREAVRLMEATG
jgi:hypothetical protein